MKLNQAQADALIESIRLAVITETRLTLTHHEARYLMDHFPKPAVPDKRARKKRVEALARIERRRDFHHWVKVGDETPSQVEQRIPNRVGPFTVCYYEPDGTLVAVKLTRQGDIVREVREGADGHA